MAALEVRVPASTTGAGESKPNGSIHALSGGEACGWQYTRSRQEKLRDYKPADEPGP